MTRGWVPASARTREGDGGWVPVPVFTGQALRGHDEGMGPRIREDKGGGRLHPHQPSRGAGSRGHDEGMGPRIREDNGRGCGRLKGKGLPVAAGFSGDDASKAWGGEMSCCNYDALLLKFLQSFPTRFDAKLG